jgi:catechol 2,3-dioxygenase-like lactoylglutathione lyase family enzyme
MPSNELGKSVHFYEKLLGTPLERSFSEFVSFVGWAAEHVQLSIADPAWKHKSPMLIFSTDDLANTLELVKAAHGKVLHPCVPLKMPEPHAKQYWKALDANSEETKSELGEMAVVEDPAGILIGIVSMPPLAQAAFRANIAHVAV